MRLCICRLTFAPYFTAWNGSFSSTFAKSRIREKSSAWRYSWLHFNKLLSVFMSSLAVKYCSIFCIIYAGRWWPGHAMIFKLASSMDRGPLYCTAGHFNDAQRSILIFGAVIGYARAAARRNRGQWSDRSDNADYLVSWRRFWMIARYFRKY